MRSWRISQHQIALALTLCLLPAFAVAQGVTVQAGATFDVGDGTLGLDCGDLTVAGTLTVANGSIVTTRHVDIAGGAFSLGTGSITLSGDWTNTGSFSAGTGSVNIVDGCATTTSAISGDSGFYDFNVTTTAGRLLQPTSGSSQTFNHDLTLVGTIANPLTIRSSSPGVAAIFTLINGASQNINGADVTDNDASGGQTIAPGPPGDFNSIDSGGNTNWFQRLVDPGLPGTPGAKPIATLPLPGLALLAFLLVLLVRHSQQLQLDRRRPSS